MALRIKMPCSLDQKKQKSAEFRGYQVHGFVNMHFVKLGVEPSTIPSKGSWRFSLEKMSWLQTTPDNFAVVVSEQSPWLWSPSAPLRICYSMHSMQAFRPHSFQMSTLSALALPAPATAPSAPTLILVTWCSQRTFPGPSIPLPAAVD